MSKKEVDSILLANKYFTFCKRCKPNCPKTELARKYLTSKIKSALYPEKQPLVKSTVLFFGNTLRSLFSAFRVF